ncbi:MAG TPA: response regulator [Gammaproteobacteria bacterium]|nr:response regulator [Gammaproteobacteria bacterium]MCP5430425.1 response regulator [Chromatiaceae bacterium]MCP5435272.1 response regulator [Chromatiaceae bacterium]HOP17344.1 response regulator [Gammaproteobacteria bacterium]HPQ23887.1 response regulator [Gammaproteobacteria bacterium]
MDTVARKVLIVDDNAGLRKLIRLTLKTAGFQLLEAENGDDALRMTKSHLPDFVLLDVMMPGSMDGYQVCSAIKNDPSLRHVRVFILSARAQQADLDAGRQAGADHYLVKPFSPVELLKLVQSYGR